MPGGCNKHLDLKAPILAIMRRFTRLFLFFLWLPSAACFGQIPANFDKKLDSAVHALIKKNKLIGIEIGILKNGRTTYYSYGEIERGTGQLPNEHTLFEIGSITKTFTTTLLACAANEGKLNLHDPINKFLPDSIPPLEYQGTPITLLTMANHFSGLPRMPANLNALSDTNYDENALYSCYMHFKLSRKPGVKFEYSNLAVATLGVILARIYGISLDSLMVEKICIPLDLSDTRLTVPAADSLRTAQGYESDGGAEPPGLNEAILLTHMVTRRQKNLAIGLAWGIDLSDGHEWFEHSGGTDGFQSFLVVDPSAHTAIVVQSNKHTRDDDLPTDLGEDILGWVEKTPLNKLV
jgi:CubicO group peptidase (beta-lactamase class C family)